MPDTEPLVLRSTTPAELIASLPHLAGTPLRNSVVVAPFWGTRTPGAIRIDLPTTGTRDTNQRLAASLLASLARLDGCDRAAVAIFTDEPYADACTGRRDLMTHLLERIQSSGYDIADASIIAADGWGCFPDDTLDRPRPLAEIEIAAPTVPDEYRIIPSRELPRTEPALAAAVEEQLFERLAFGADLDAWGRSVEAPLPEPIAFLEKALAGDPASAGPQTLTRLIALLDSEGAVDRTVLQIAFGPEIGDASWQSTLSVRRRALDAGCAPMDILQQDYDEAPDLVPFGQLLSGRSSERPSPARLAAGAQLLGRAVAHCPPQHRAWLMCALAWVRWATGLSSVAVDLLVAAEEFSPGNTLVPVYATIFTHFSPTWVFDRARDTAAPANRAERRRAARARSRRSA